MTCPRCNSEVGTTREPQLCQSCRAATIPLNPASTDNNRKALERLAIRSASLDSLPEDATVPCNNDPTWWDRAHQFENCCGGWDGVNHAPLCPNV
jgi:hypothetical protein